MTRTFIIGTFLSILFVVPATAQNYKRSRYYNPDTGRLDYSQRYRSGSYSTNDCGLKSTYVGFRIGPSFSHVSSDDPALDGSTWKTGLNVGVALGTKIAYTSPLYLETGLYYTEKGGDGNGGRNGAKFTYDLNYLEIPLLIKYKAPVSNDVSIEPYFGGYFAVGVGGKIKDYDNRAAYNSFSSNSYDSGTFRRCDGGLKFGLGASLHLSRDADLYMGGRIFQELTAFPKKIRVCSV